MSVGTALKSHLSEAEYLLWEEAQESRHEYYDGQIVAMSGGSFDHNRIVQNLSTELGIAFKAKHCECFTQSQKVRIAQKHSFLYPDVVVTCGGTQKGEGYAILNPLLAVEVLSPSTARRDWNEKREAYQSLPTLQEYVVIAQDTPRVALYRRGENDTWQESVIVGMNAMLILESIGLEIPFTDLYARVEFETND